MAPTFIDKLDVVAGILNIAGGVLELVAEELGELVGGGALFLIVAVIGEPPPIVNVFEQPETLCFN